VTCSLLKDLGEISRSKMQIFGSGFSVAEISLRPGMRLSYKFSLLAAELEPFLGGDLEPKSHARCAGRHPEGLLSEQQ